VRLTIERSPKVHRIPRFSSSFVSANDHTIPPRLPHANMTPCASPLRCGKYSGSIGART
jgi:hypothetical protein